MRHIVAVEPQVDKRSTANPERGSRVQRARPGYGAAYLALFVALSVGSVAVGAPLVFWGGFLVAAWATLDASLAGTAGRWRVLGGVTALVVALEMVGGPVTF